MRRFIAVGTALLLGIMLHSCASPQVEEGPDYLSGAQFFQETKKLITMETDQEFWSVLQDYQLEFPQETTDLMKEYGLWQIKLAEHYLEEGDHSRALFHTDNLRVIPVGVFENGEVEELQERVSEARNEALSLMIESLRTEGSAYTTNGESPSRPQDALAEISVQYFWKSKEGDERFSMDNVDGTGFLITPRHVLTAFHVVDEALDDFYHRYEVSVKFGEEEMEEVRILSWDALTDLVVLELPEALERPYLYDRIVSSASLKQGDAVYAMGHPYGYTYTLTKGIVSSESRNAWEWGDWLQVDTVIAPGMSGGILANSDMEIVGMVTAGLMGEEVNFAVPSDLILKVLDRLIAGETVQRPWAGILFNENLSVNYVFEESPLVEEGIRAGVELLKVNGTAVSTIAEAQSVLDNLSSGNLISMEFSNGVETKDCFFKLMRRPTETLYNKIVRMDIYERVSIAAGVKLDESTAETENLRTSQGTFSFKTVVVETIDQTSFLYSRAVREGDRLGLLEDGFNDHRYYIELLHIPEGKTVHNLEDISDMVFTINRDKYSENVL